MPSRPGMARSSDRTSGRCFGALHERLVAVGGDRDNLRSPLREAVCDHVPHEGRVVGDDDANSGR